MRLLKVELKDYKKSLKPLHKISKIVG